MLLDFVCSCSLKAALLWHRWSSGAVVMCWFPLDRHRSRPGFAKAGAERMGPGRCEGTRGRKARPENQR